jgi:hypothetical protein
MPIKLPGGLVGKHLQNYQVVEWGNAYKTVPGGLVGKHL